MLITVNGLVTRSYLSGDHDRVIHIITEDHGRLAVMVKGGNSKRGGGAAAATKEGGEDIAKVKAAAKSAKPTETASGKC